MPKLPSPYRIPEEHLLPDDELRAEAATRDFQRTVNRQKYLAWHTLVRKVKPDARYETTSYGFETETRSRQEILDQVRPAINTRGCTFVNSVTRVPDDHTTSVEALWHTVAAPDGSVQVWNHDQDAFDLSTLADNSLEVEAPITDAYGPEFLYHRVGGVIKRRRGQHELTPEFQDVIVTTRSAISNGLASTPSPTHPSSAIPLTDDRAFALLRISAAGVNLDDHPEFRFYQKFFELRMPPPSHVQMADTVIATLMDSSNLWVMIPATP